MDTTPALFDPTDCGDAVAAELLPGDAETGTDLAAADRDRQLSAGTVAAIASSVPDSTRRAYAGDRRAFAAWCAENGRTALPATAETVAEYVRHLTVAPRPRTGRPSSPSSIERAMSAVTTWHRQERQPRPEMDGARAVLNTYKNALAEADHVAARTQQATAATPRELRAMLHRVDRATLAGKRNAALVLLGFATAARVSELVSLNITAVTETEHGYDVRLYRKKVRRWTTTAILYGTDPATCPVRALRAYLDTLAATGRTSGPLFLRVDRHGRIAAPMTRRGRPIGDPSGRLTAEAAADIVELLAVTAGLSGTWSGHSLRRGFATAARAAGHDPLEIARQGGWADGSRTLARYMAEVDRITNSPLVGIGL
ncbi:site-specific integrase [Streptomyces sp. TR06-5]|uniref:site-specific integrase n=1 Tax=Streptomyces sp. TR06-5 TaxID=3385976 RepID=UPI00399FFC37